MSFNFAWVKHRLCRMVKLAQYKIERVKSALIVICILVIILQVLHERRRMQDYDILSKMNPEFRNSPQFEKKLNFFMFKIRNEDRKRIEFIKNLQVEKISNIDAKRIFFEYLSLPAQSVCKVLKRIGGWWMVGDPAHGQHQQVDGDKFVCLDDMLEKDDCVVYSFGVAGDWTFEDQMDAIGCSVYAYDHTVLALPYRGQNIHFFKTGLGFGKDLKPLSQLIRENSHTDTIIDFLKIDIEMYELSEGGFVDWIKSGALENVNQIGVELHVEHFESNSRQYIELLQILQDLYKIGFRVISHEPNMVKGPGPDGIYNFVEVVFMKEKLL